MVANLLKAKIVQEGFNTRNFVGKINEHGVDMSTATFYRKINGTSEFNQTEISVIAKVLELSSKEIMDIFFTSNVS
jgi:hypothetical protein